MTDSNTFAFVEWMEYGGVLGYDTEKNGNVKLYVMDEGEFADRYFEYINGRCDIKPGLNMDEFAEILCESALINVGVSEENVKEILNIFKED